MCMGIDYYRIMGVAFMSEKNSNPKDLELKPKGLLQILVYETGQS
jgi:hypothetical protein